MSNIDEIGKQPEKVKEHENNKKGIKLFFGEKEAEFFHQAGREITEKILLESFLLYRIDLKKTKTHKLYGEAKQKVWMPEIEVFGRINVTVDKPSFQSKGGPIKKGMGNFTAHIYIEHLEELKLIWRKSDNEIISSMRMGDFLEFKGQFYKIIDDGHSQFSNQHSWGGDRKFFISIEAVEIDEDIFKAR